MTPEELITLWELQVEAFRAFISEQPLIPDWGIRHAEAFSKLKQSGMALKKFRAYEVTLATRGFRHSDEVEDLQFYAEVFYYFAWRFVRLLRLVKARRADGLTYEPFKQFAPEGVRRARNHLIEHTEKPGGVAVSYSKFFCPEGFVMQYEATDAQGPLDRGLYPNAEQLLADLDQRIRLATAAGRRVPKDQGGA